MIIKRPFGAAPPAAPAPASPTGRPTVRTALPCRPERRGCLARAPRSQAEHGAAWRWLMLDRRRRMGESNAQAYPGVRAARESRFQSKSTGNLPGKLLWGPGTRAA
jgi:hypothetical protein